MNLVCATRQVSEVIEPNSDALKLNINIIAFFVPIKITYNWYDGG